MLVIRLARTGRHKYPTYRIVAADKRKAATGKFVSVLGHYNPHTKELVMDTDSIQTHLKNGAQPSNTVIRLLNKEKITIPGWAKLETKHKKPKSEPTVKEVKESIADNQEPVEALDANANKSDGESVAEIASEHAEEVAAQAPVDEKNDTETAADVEAETEKAVAIEAAAAEVATQAPETINE